MRVLDKNKIDYSYEIVKQNGSSKVLKALIRFEDITLVTEFVNSDDEICTWGQEVRLSADGNGAAIYLWASPFTSARLREMADALDRAKIEAEKYKDQIKV